MFIILQLDDSYNTAHGSGSRSQVEGESTSPGRKRKRVGTSQGRGQSGRGKSSSTASQPSAATVKTSYHVISFHIEIHYATLMCFYSVFFFLSKICRQFMQYLQQHLQYQKLLPNQVQHMLPQVDVLLPNQV
jgi:hypothetical protein